MEGLALGYQGGMPLNENTLRTLQNNTLEVLSTLINHLGVSAYGFYIISGCEVIGATITDGIMVIDGKICPFFSATGTVNSKIGITEQVIDGFYKNGVNHPLIRKTTASILTNGTKLSDFIRIPKVQDLVNQATSWNDIPNKPAVVIDPANLTTTPPEKTVLERIAKLERQNAVFIAGGGMVLWNKPANEIPTDWQEVVNWKGRMPVGVNDQLNAVGQFVDPEFSQLGYSNGYKNHRISMEEMPKHNHSNFYYDVHSGVNIGGSGGFDIGGPTPTGYTGGLPDGTTKEFSILNPYRTVYFIEYIGL